MKNKNHNIIIIIGILLLFIVVIYSSYAIFNSSSTSEPNTINTGNIILTFTEGETVSFDGNNAITDDEGKALENYFEFAASATAENKLKLANYIYAIPDASNTLDAQYVKVYLSLYQDGTETPLTNPTAFNSLTRFNLSTMTADNTANNYLIYSNTIDFTTTETKSYNYTFRLRLWLDESYPGDTPTITNTDNGTAGASHKAEIGPSKTFKFKINAYNEQGDLKL